MPKDGWKRFARGATEALRERLERLSGLSPEDRERLARRFQSAIAHALEVPPDLQVTIEESAARLIAENSQYDPVSIAWQRTRERARRTAAIGAVTTVPAVMPGIGSALAALGLVADWRFVAEQQRDLVLEIAALFGEWPENPTVDARNLFLVASASAFANPSAGRFVMEVLERQVARRGVARLLPGAGAAVAGALNYIATIALGRAAIEHFGERAGVQVSGVIPSEVHPAVPQLRTALAEAIETQDAASLFGPGAKSALATLRASDREELLDLAATLTVAAGRDPGDDPLLRKFAVELGSTADQSAEAAARALRDARPVREKLGSALQRVATKGGTAADFVWRKAARLARARKRKRRRKRDSS
jgi:hypothetical protein